MFWKLIAKILAIPPITSALIKQASKTPFTHMVSKDGSKVYQYRYWLFNPIANGERKWRWIPLSIKLCRLVARDPEDYLHDYPWPARTFVLRGCYGEHRLFDKTCPYPIDRLFNQWHTYDLQETGSTSKLGFERDWHSITFVPKVGAWVMMASWGYDGVWGFLVDGKKVQWHEHLGRDVKVAQDDEITCAARQQSDMMSCARCGIGWDMNDQYPPVCRHKHPGRAS